MKSLLQNCNALALTSFRNENLSSILLAKVRSLERRAARPGSCHTPIQRGGVEGVVAAVERSVGGAERWRPFPPLFCCGAGGRLAQAGPPSFPLKSRL